MHIIIEPSLGGNAISAAWRVTNIIKGFLQGVLCRALNRSCIQKRLVCCRREGERASINQTDRLIT